MLKEYSHKISRLHRVIDSLIIILAWYLSYILRFTVLAGAQKGLLGSFSFIGIGLFLVSLYVFEKFGFYKSFRLKSVFYEIGLVTKANIILFVVLIFSLYFVYEEKISRVHLLFFFIFSELGLVTLRLLKSNSLRLLRNRGRNVRRVKTIGDGGQLLAFVKLIKGLPGSGIEISDSENVDAYVVSFRSENSAKMDAFLRDHYNDVKPIHILPDVSYSLLGHRLENFNGLPVITVNQPEFPVFDLILKRLIDFLAATIGLMLISPLMLIVAIAVKLSSPGPIFYGQRRIGLDGREFVMWKFRSMKVARGTEDVTTWSSESDPRKTKVGSFIRSTSIDEFPQFWNILTGDMSLIGPRPERSYFVEKFRREIPGYMLRHKMKPGLTGWAQVNGWRGDTSLIKRIECDIFYIKNWSIWLDLKIVLLTFVKGFLNKNAY